MYPTRSSNQSAICCLGVHTLSWALPAIRRELHGFRLMVSAGFLCHRRALPGRASLSFLLSALVWLDTTFFIFRLSQTLKSHLALHHFGIYWGKEQCMLQLSLQHVTWPKSLSQPMQEIHALPAWWMLFECSSLSSKERPVPTLLGESLTKVPRMGFLSHGLWLITPAWRTIVSASKAFGRLFWQFCTPFAGRQRRGRKGSKIARYRKSCDIGGKIGQTVGLQDGLLKSVIANRSAGGEGDAASQLIGTPAIHPGQLNS